MLVVLAKSHSENSIVPLEVHTGNIQIALQGIKGEIVVADSPRSLVFEVVYDDSVAVDVGNVSESFTALFRHNINKLQINK
jgi:hypothetical protein